DEPPRRRSVLQTRRGIDDIAGRQCFAASRLLDRDDRVPGVDGGPCGELETADRIEYPEPGTDGALSVVAVRDRRAEHGHDGVADELLDHTAVPLDSVLVFPAIPLQHVSGRL